MHHIDTFGPPVYAKPPRLAPDGLKIAKMEFQHTLDLGDMHPLDSNYASPLHFLRKEVTIGVLLATTGLSTVKPNETSKAFHQIPIAPENVDKTTICTSFGLLESTRMKFGVYNASNTFQIFIDEVTRRLEGAYAFTEDILIASQSYEEHIEHLRALFYRLDHYGLTTKLSKGKFGVPTLDFLEFTVSKDGISPILDRVDAIQKFPRPGYTYKRKSLRPTKKSEPSLQWSEEAEKAFTDAKKALAEPTLLKPPIPGAPLSLWTDASNVQIGNSLI
ncbi:hypothetical protein NPIL_468351 [Nephila pilipes]|uniref:Reverse transcriptase domain-containing protein n=1 Tax=Nephila pilipes TaxID=299642 RepID=A0A8X6Q7Q8_NEPPI|nr:hypothetical protein NPIL_468351 [Nephila pilipes]